MENNKITFGRYKNKTFQEVYDSDKKYCEMVLSSHDKGYRGDTSAFKEFLKTKLSNNNKSKTLVVNENSYSENNFGTVLGNLTNNKNNFITNNWNNNLLKPCFPIKPIPVARKILKKYKEGEYLYIGQFIRSKTIQSFIYMVGELTVISNKVHPKSNIILTSESNKKFEYSPFHFMFLKKCIHNLYNQTAVARKPEKMSLSFPFELDWNYIQDDSVNLDILPYMVEVLEDVENYMTRYRIKIPDLEKEIKHLFAQITFKSAEDEDIKRLLNVKYYLSDKQSYLNALKKFMLFYILQKEYDKKVALYDPYMRMDDDTFLKQQYNVDILWKYVQSYRIYQYYKGDIFNILPDIFRSSCLNVLNYYMYCKNQDLDMQNICKKNLQHIKEYVESIKSTIQQYPSVDVFPSFKQFEVNEEGAKFNDEKVTIFKVDTCFLLGVDEIFLVNKDTLMLFAYSFKTKDRTYDFLKLILHAVMLNFPIKKLMIYNAYLGEQTTTDMIENTEPIKAFIREHRDPDILFHYLSTKSEDVKYNGSGQIEVRLFNDNGRDIGEAEECSSNSTHSMLTKTEQEEKGINK